MQNAALVPAKKGFLHVLAMMIATGLGSGFVPKAPGTAGTVVGLAAVILIDRVFPGSFGTDFLIFGIALFFAGWWASLRWSQYHSQTDCQQIVIDEVLGYFVALGTLPHTWGVLLTQFLLFRIFDAWKPWPIRALDRWGKNFPVGPAQSFMVIFDDLLAGLLCWAITATLLPWIGTWIGA